MKALLRLAAVLLLLAMLVGCNLFNSVSMEVTYSSSTIQNGGTVKVTGLDLTFSAVNTGLSTIEFTGSPRVQIGYITSGSWTLQTDLPTTLGGGDSVNFKIRSSGSGSARVTIPNNKGNDFIFYVSY
ncbi:MAG TPA: hypothetical protein VMW87_04365 [Spirochaetia bacterium]|nr:hypothetical protein [Spirochaetia bacterium]